MKVYTYVHINMDGHETQAESYEYHGEITLLKGPKTPPPPPPDPYIAEKELEEEKLRERIRRGTIGRKSTILTGGQGVMGEPTITRKTLLGQ